MNDEVVAAGEQLAAILREALDVVRDVLSPGENEWNDAARAALARWEAALRVGDPETP